MRRPLGRKLYYSIGEVSELTQLQPYTLRAWEKEFSCLRPRRVRGKNRAYRERDIGIILLIKRLLYEERYSTRGVRQKLKKDPQLIQRAVDAAAKLTASPRSAPDFALSTVESSSPEIDAEPKQTPTGTDSAVEEMPAPSPSSSVGDAGRADADRVDADRVDADRSSASSQQLKDRIEEIVQDLDAVIKLLA